MQSIIEREVRQRIERRYCMNRIADTGGKTRQEIVQCVYGRCRRAIRAEIKSVTKRRLNRLPRERRNEAECDERKIVRNHLGKPKKIHVGKKRAKKFTERSFSGIRDELLALFSVTEESDEKTWQVKYVYSEALDCALVLAVARHECPQAGGREARRALWSSASNRDLRPDPPIAYPPTFVAKTIDEVTRKISRLTASPK